MEKKNEQVVSNYILVVWQWFNSQGLITSKSLSADLSVLCGLITWFHFSKESSLNLNNSKWKGEKREEIRKTAGKSAELEKERYCTYRSKEGEERNLYSRKRGRHDTKTFRKRILIFFFYNYSSLKFSSWHEFHRFSYLNWTNLH